MEEYKGIINELISKYYKEVLVINVFDDKIYKYNLRDGQFICTKELSYAKYLNDCKDFIYQDDLDNYIKALSISNLENNNNHLTINYKKKDDIGSYQEYSCQVILYDNNKEKLIVELITEGDNTKDFKSDNTIKSNVENKLNKLVDAVGMTILKIHNIINSDSGINTKKEYINSLLSDLTNQYPEFNEVLNDNAMNLYNNNKSSIMIIDDDKMTCNLIKKIFDNNYSVVIANNGREAIDYFNNMNQDNDFRNNISCIFLDLLMPVLDGFSVLDYLNDNNYLDKIPVVIISGNYDKDTRNKAYSYQIADMLEKPFNVQVVRHRIENLIGLYKSSNSLNGMLLEQHKDLKNIVNSLITAYELDNEKKMKLVRKYTRILALQVSSQYPEYNISSNMIDKIADSAVYFSIGDYTLPKSIMYKKGIYTEEERSIINMTNINGANIVKYVLSKENTKIDPKYCYEITKYYNERYDGNGYPEGLSSNSIPLSVQIASVAIEYSNLINTLVPVDYEKVASLIIMESGRKFSPRIIDSFKKVSKDFEEITKVGG